VHFVSDIFRRIVEPASTGDDRLIAIDNYLLTVGTGIIPVSPARLAVSLVILQASIANAGVICIGGPMVTTATGLELDPGRGILFAGGEPTDLQKQMMLGGMGASMFQQYYGAMQPSERESIWSRLRSRRGPVSVIDLNSQLFVVATALNQGLRILYVTPQR